MNRRKQRGIDQEFMEGHPNIGGSSSVADKRERIEYITERSEPAARSQKILILSLSGIGNFIMHSPFFEVLKREWPDSRITVGVALRGTKVLAENNHYIDQVIEVKIKTSPWQHFRQLFFLASQKFDIGIVLSPGQLWKSAAYLWLAGIKKRVGSSYSWRGNTESGFLLTDALIEKNNIHDIQQNLLLLRPLNIISPESGDLEYVLTVSDQDTMAAKDLADQLGVDISERIVGFHAGSAEDLKAKRWPVSRYIEVGKLLIEEGTQILLFGGSEEEQMKLAMKTVLGERAFIVRADLLTTIAVIKLCDVFLANDSGLMHAAAAVGVKTIGLFGPTDEILTGPRGSKSETIRANGAKAVYDTDRNFQLGSAPHKSMRAISVKQVMQKIR